jgi:flagellar biosynthetic protein FliR
MILSVPQLQVFMLVLARVTGVFVEVPIFSDRTINRSARLALIFWVSFVLWTVTPFQGAALPTNNLLFGLVLIKEAFVGFTIGLIVKLIFSGIEAGGELIGSQMGLSVATILNPASGSQQVVVTQLLRFLVITIFLAMDGHHLILEALFRSYSAVSMVTGNLNFPDSGIQVLRVGGELFKIALSIATPIMLVIFLLDFAFGMVARVAPQVNIFQLGFQLKPSLGMFIMLLTLPFLVDRITVYLGLTIEEIARMYQAFNP